MSYPKSAKVAGSPFHYECSIPDKKQRKNINSIIEVCCTQSFHEGGDARPHPNRTFTALLEESSLTMSRLCFDCEIVGWIVECFPCDVTQKRPLRCNLVWARHCMKNGLVLVIDHPVLGGRWKTCGSKTFCAFAQKTLNLFFWARNLWCTYSNEFHIWSCRYGRKHPLPPPVSSPRTDKCKKLLRHLSQHD